MSVRLECPLCGSESQKIFYDQVEKAYGKMVRRAYFRCQDCRLIHLNPQFRLSPEKEKQRYQEHDNQITKSYLKFLSLLWGPLKSHLQEGMTGLDYGCGPVQAMAQLAAEDGFQLDSYDLYFYPEGGEGRPYDFLILSEVIEHFAEVGVELERCLSYLKPGGIVAVMTEIYEQQDFKAWHYRMDPTHISLFSVETFDALAKQFQLQLLFRDSRVHIFKSTLTETP